MVRVEAKRCFVAVVGEVVTCSIRGRFFEGDRYGQSPVVVGDLVRLELSAGEGVIEEVLPRTSQFAKPSGRDGRRQVMAANVDLLVIVASLASPPLRSGVIDRFLVIAEREGIVPLIVINKVDLGDPRDALAIAERYQRLGYEVLQTSAESGEGLPELRRRMEHHTALFVGHSGVGKSSLMNRANPGLELKVSDVSAKHGKGRHTTTSVQLIAIGPDTFIVDSPGVREILVPDMPDSAELGRCFPEIRAHEAGCRYPNCTHSHEPDCSVKEAVASGAIHPERFESYLRILKGEGRQERHDSY